jgi:hypothetical protein
VVSPGTSTEGLSTRLVALSEKVVGTEGAFTLPVIRRCSLADSLNIMSLQNDTEKILKPLRVVFLGESAVDEGGPRREFATLMVAQAQCRSLNLFTKGMSI